MASSCHARANPSIQLSHSLPADMIYDMPAPTRRQHRTPSNRPGRPHAKMPQGRPVPSGSAAARQPSTTGGGRPRLTRLSNAPCYFRHPAGMMPCTIPIPARARESRSAPLRPSALLLPSATATTPCPRMTRGTEINDTKCTDVARLAAADMLQAAKTRVMPPRNPPQARRGVHKPSHPLSSFLSAALSAPLPPSPNRFPPAHHFSPSLPLPPSLSPQQRIASHFHLVAERRRDSSGRPCGGTSQSPGGGGWGRDARRAPSAPSRAPCITLLSRKADEAQRM